jgi:hypothetical protein
LVFGVRRGLVLVLVVVLDILAKVSIEVDPVDEVDGSGRATLRVLWSAACASALGYFTAPSFRFEDETSELVRQAILAELLTRVGQG